MKLMGLLVFVVALSVFRMVASENDLLYKDPQPVCGRLDLYPEEYNACCRILDISKDANQCSQMIYNCVKAIPSLFGDQSSMVSDVLSSVWKDLYVSEDDHDEEDEEEEDKNDNCSHFSTRAAFLAFVSPRNIAEEFASIHVIMDNDYNEQGKSVSWPLCKPIEVLNAGNNVKKLLESCFHVREIDVPAIAYSDFNYATVLGDEDCVHLKRMPDPFNSLFATPLAETIMVEFTVKEGARLQGANAGTLVCSNQRTNVSFQMNHKGELVEGSVFDTLRQLGGFSARLGYFGYVADLECVIQVSIPGSAITLSFDTINDLSRPQYGDWIQEQNSLPIRPSHEHVGFEVETGFFRLLYQAQGMQKREQRRLVPMLSMKQGVGGSAIGWDMTADFKTYNSKTYEYAPDSDALARCSEMPGTYSKCPAREYFSWADVEIVTKPLGDNIAETCKVIGDIRNTFIDMNKELVKALPEIKKLVTENCPILTKKGVSYYSCDNTFYSEMLEKVHGIAWTSDAICDNSGKGELNVIAEFPSPILSAFGKENLWEVSKSETNAVVNMDLAEQFGAWVRPQVTFNVRMDRVALFFLRTRYEVSNFLFHVLVTHFTDLCPVASKQSSFISRRYSHYGRILFDKVPGWAIGRSDEIESRGNGHS